MFKTVADPVAIKNFTTEEKANTWENVNQYHRVRMTRRNTNKYPSVLKWLRDTKALTGFANIATDFFFHDDSFLTFHAVETPPLYTMSRWWHAEEASLVA